MGVLDWIGRQIEIAVGWIETKARQVGEYISNLRKPREPETVTQAPRYDASAGTNYTESINERIHQFRNANLPGADQLEREAVEACRVSFASHVAGINDFISQRNLDIDTDELNQASEGLEKRFQGRLRAYMTSHFDLSDHRCKAAFEAYDTSQRLECWNRVIDGGLDELNGNITAYFKEQNELIQEAIRARVQEQGEMVAMEKAQLSQLLAVKDADATQQEIAKMRVLFSVDCCDIGLQCIEGAMAGDK